MNRVYIAGKITGLDYITTFKKFNEAEKRLTRLGFHVVNPMLLVRNPQANWNLAMRICISTMVENCDSIYLLPDWNLSRGAKLEYQIANELEFKLITNEMVRDIEENQTSKKAI